MTAEPDSGNRPVAMTPTPDLGAIEPQPASHLRGSLGVTKITLMVIAAAAPLTVVGGAVLLGIGLGNGTGFPLVFIAITIALLLFAVGFVAMTPYVKSAGAFYSYIALGLGRPVGLGAGYVALFSYLVIEPGLLALLGSGANALFSSYGFTVIPWWGYSLIGLAFMLLLGHRNIDLAGRVLGVILVLEIAIVLVLDAAIIADGGGPEGFSTQFADPTQIFSGNLGLAIMFAVLSFIGFETAAVFRDEARDPARTIPRATYTSVVVVGVFYAVASWAMISGIGQSRAVEYANENTATMLGDVTRTYLGTYGGHVVELLFVSSVFACSLSFHNISARYIHSLAQNRALPAFFGETHGTYGSPARASLACGVVGAVGTAIAVAASLDPVTQVYTWLSSVISVGVLLLMAMTCLATIVFFRRGKIPASVWKVVIAPGLGLLALAAGLFLVVKNLPSLVGNSVPIAVAVMVLIVAAFVAGIVVAVMRPAANRDSSDRNTVR